MQNKYAINSLSSFVSTNIFVFACLILLLNTLNFWLGNPISLLSLTTSLILSIAFCILSLKLSYPKVSLIHLLSAVFIFLVILLISLMVAGSFYDLSYDGQNYHQNAIYQLANGWNPFRSKTESIWVEHYPKGAWIYAASIYKLLGKIEFGKAFNIAFILASFLSTFCAINTSNKISVLPTLLYSFLLAFNPVSVYQSLSYYVDGQLSSLLIALGGNLYLFLKNPEYLNSISIIALGVLLISIKFTGLIYLTLIAIAFIIILLIQKTSFYHFLWIILISLFLGIFFVGYNPYITNTYYHGHPFYPLAGKGSVDIISVDSGQAPPIFRNKNQLERFLISNFSQPGNYLGLDSKNIRFVVPFALNKRDFNQFAMTDLRIGGFGPLFGSMLILSAIITLFLFIKSDISQRISFIKIFLTLLLTVIINPAFWWARYVPQLYSFPLLSSYFALASNYQNKILTFFGRLVVIIALINIFGIGLVYLKTNIKQTRYVNTLMSSLLNSKVFIHINKENGFIAPKIRLIDQKIQYQEFSDSNDLPCAFPKKYPFTEGIIYCTETSYLK